MTTLPQRNCFASILMALVASFGCSNGGDSGASQTTGQTGGAASAATTTSNTNSSEKGGTSNDDGSGNGNTSSGGSSAKVSDSKANGGSSTKPDTSSLTGGASTTSAALNGGTSSAQGGKTTAEAGGTKATDKGGSSATGDGGAVPKGGKSATGGGQSSNTTGAPTTGGAATGGKSSSGGATGGSSATGGTFTLTMPGFTPTAGCSDAAKASCAPLPTEIIRPPTGAGTSPALEWTGAPAGTKSFVVVLQDISNGTAHWILWNIAATVTSLPANIDQKTATPATPAGSQQCGKGTDAATSDGFYGPGAPCNAYEFLVYALSIEKFSPTSATDEKSVRTQLQALGSSILGTASIRGKTNTGC